MKYLVKQVTERWQVVEARDDREAVSIFKIKSINDDNVETHYECVEVDNEDNN